MKKVLTDNSVEAAAQITFTWQEIAEAPQCPSFDLLLKCIKFRRTKKFTERDSQAVAYHLDGNELGVLALPVQYVFDTGRRKRRNGGQLVDSDITLTAQRKNAISDRSYSIHALPPPYDICS